MIASIPDVSGTVFDDKTLLIARSYAEAIINAATKTGQVEAVVGELEELDDDLIKANPKFGEFLSSSSVPSDAKERVLNEALSGRALPTVLNFLHVLNRHGRLGLLAPIAQEARALWDKKQNRRPVTIRSAIELDEGQKLAIKDKVSAMIGGTAIPSYSVDPSLIGGLVIQVEDDLYDASIKTKLAAMRRQLIQGKSSAISKTQAVME